MWIFETRQDEFVGGGGLTWQSIDGEPHLEAGYHVKSELQGRGYATEAARACLALATEVIGSRHTVAIINPA